MRLTNPIDLTEVRQCGNCPVSYDSVRREYLIGNSGGTICHWTAG